MKITKSTDIYRVNLRRYNLFFGTLLLSGSLAGAAVSDQAKQESKLRLCNVNFLSSLGWQITEGDVSEISIVEGNPCDNKSIDEVVSESELRIIIPKGKALENQAVLDQKLKAIIDSEATKCAYKIKVSQAVKKATQKLAAQTEKGSFTFGKQEDLSCVSKSGSQEWKKGGNDGFLDINLMAAASPARAVESFYEGVCKAECLVGRQVASLATQYELFGPSDFNLAFSNKQVVIGRVAGFSDSPLENTVRDFPAIYDENGERLSKMGPQALVGVTGYIGNVKGADFLDSPVDRGENFIITEMSKLASDTLNKNGGFSAYNKTNELAWTEYNSEKAQGKKNPTKHRERLKDAFYTQTKVYVHPLGIMTLGEHIERLLRINPRTPYTFRLYPDRNMTNLYEIYKKYKLSKCLEGPEPELTVEHFKDTH